MTVVQDAVVFLDKLGVWDVILPFIFVFTVSYATLEKTKVLGSDKGEPRHRFNAMVSAVIGLFVIVAVDVLNVVSRLSQYKVVVILDAVCLAVIFGFFGFTDVRKTRYGKYFLPIAFLVFGVVVLYALGLGGYLDISALRRYEGLLIVLIVFFLIMWFVLREGKPITAGKAPAKPAEERPAPGPTPEEGPAPGEQRPITKEEFDKMPIKQKEGILYNMIAAALSDEGKANFQNDLKNTPPDQRLQFLLGVAKNLGLL
jgi:hypothetical protein